MLAVAMRLGSILNGWGNSVLVTGSSIVPPKIIHRGYPRVRRAQGTASRAQFGHG